MASSKSLSSGWAKKMGSGPISEAPFMFRLSKIASGIFYASSLVWVDNKRIFEKKINMNIIKSIDALILCRSWIS
jgi:hypothetical protein